MASIVCCEAYKGGNETSLMNRICHRNKIEQHDRFHVVNAEPFPKWRVKTKEREVLWKIEKLWNGAADNTKASREKHSRRQQTSYYIESVACGTRTWVPLTTCSGALRRHAWKRNEPETIKVTIGKRPCALATAEASKALSRRCRMKASSVWNSFSLCFILFDNTYRAFCL